MAESQAEGSIFDWLADFARSLLSLQFGLKMGALAANGRIKKNIEHLSLG